MAEAACEPSRPGCDQLISTWAAVTGADAGLGQRRRRNRGYERTQLFLKLLASAWAARVRSAVSRNARTVARSSTGSLGWAAVAEGLRYRHHPDDPVRELVADGVIARATVLQAPRRSGSRPPQSTWSGRRLLG
jgi:hypothetical protein